MKKQFRIKKNKEFQLAFREGKSFANRQLVIYYLEKTEQAHFRIGLSVGKKIGNAVVRNRIKRYLRKAFQELEADILRPADIVIIARNPTNKMGYEEIKKSLIHLLNRERLLRRRTVRQGNKV
ncbi:ribonuclease P protein component [Virgibacillus halotolerans]|uniref:ribonuclease P protein component n=1 Tax=Virgibacillus halotolerans TaxID=1071053 RepID=UPI00195F90C0|nr:ribonuclease P protein component [Virgibacillus halotolerans]MBM7601360.1 ribonuclease P protein component [Virgibacillus halotolerans]